MQRCNEKISNYGRYRIEMWNENLGHWCQVCLQIVSVGYQMIWQKTGIHDYNNLKAHILADFTPSSVCLSVCRHAIPVFFYRFSPLHRRMHFALMSLLLQIIKLLTLLNMYRVIQLHLSNFSFSWLEKAKSVRV